MALQRPLVIACAALTADLRAVLDASGLGDAVETDYLPARLHNTPQHIVANLRPRIEAANRVGRAVFVAYADCGTGGQLDAMLDDYPGVHRLPGAHCYEFFAGTALFHELHEQQLGTFYLTDFLAKHFDALVWDGLGIGRAPQLRDVYFANYTRLILLAQTDDLGITALAEAAATRLGLAFERHFVGRAGLGDAVEVAIGSASRTDHATIGRATTQRAGARR